MHPLTLAHIAVTQPKVAIQIDIQYTSLSWVERLVSCQHMSIDIRTPCPYSYDPLMHWPMPAEIAVSQPIQITQV